MRNFVAPVSYFAAVILPYHSLLRRGVEYALVAMSVSDNMPLEG